MDRNVLRPFGMRHSGYVWSAALRRNLARRHDEQGAPMPLAPSTAIDVARYGSAGSLMTTAPDFARFLIEVMKPRPADAWRLRASSVREMLAPVIDVPSPVRISWALGWQVWHLEGGDVIAHGGDDTGWHAQSAFSPERRSGFVILTNGEQGADLIGKALLAPLFSWL
jgi:CubicO group peptidase (beta-lactamase class C family)